MDLLKKHRLDKLEKILGGGDRIYVKVPSILGKDGKTVVSSDVNGQTWYTDEEYEEITKDEDHEVIVCFT